MQLNEFKQSSSVTDFNPPRKIKPLRFANLCLLQTIQLFSSVSVSIFVQKSKNFPHNSSLNVPLLPESGHAKDEEKVTDSYPSTENTASFFHTCFNGLNAISGFYHMYSFFFFFYPQVLIVSFISFLSDQTSHLFHHFHFFLTSKPILYLLILLSF